MTDWPRVAEAVGVTVAALAVAAAVWLAWRRS